MVELADSAEAGTSSTGAGGGEAGAAGATGEGGGSCSDFLALRVRLLDVRDAVLASCRGFLACSA